MEGYEDEDEAPEETTEWKHLCSPHLEHLAELVLWGTRESWWINCLKKCAGLQSIKYMVQYPAQLSSFVELLCDSCWPLLRKVDLHLDFNTGDVLFSNYRKDSNKVREFCHARNIKFNLSKRLAISMTLCLRHINITQQIFSFFCKKKFETNQLQSPHDTYNSRYFGQL